MKQAARHVLEDDPKADYESTVIHMAKTQDIACRKIADLAWSEIDSEDMYTHAVQEIWPKIMAREAVA